MNFNAVLAVFKRNLASYFGSPSGYVFICAFLLASGLAAFWPQEFFDSNLANLDQLNRFLPLIFLGFIPAITMSVWADERRQGTDELLLTLPGSDLAVVIGKYLGAVAIFTVSLLFSLLANIYVLSDLGSPDLGLLFSTYVGYWFVGLSMLGIGMVASFLTPNLTVAFILGVAFNTPIALLADWQWGVSENFLDFSRGIISISSMAFFFGLACSMLYLCSVLIGRRHWAGGPTGTSRAFHHGVRTLATIIVALSITMFFRNNDFIRLDATAEKLSTLSDGSLALIDSIEKENGAIEIEAFVSPADAMPESYVQTRINLLSTLRELERDSQNLTVNVYTIDAEDNASLTAEKYGVINLNGNNPPLSVQEQGRWTTWNKDLYLGLVVKGNAGQQTIPFFYKGLPVEYEIMRTIMAVSGSSVKKRIGIFKTDAPMMGAAGMGMMGIPMGGGSPPWLFVTELKKQYDVQEVTGGPINKGDYDALVVVQPSTLEEEKLGDLIAAIKAGVPTAIFEDPLPLINGSFPGTYEPRRSNQQGGGPGQPPPPAPSKGDISKLWSLLGVHFNVAPKDRLAGIRQVLGILRATANQTLTPLAGFPETGAFFGKLGELEAKSAEFEARVKANSPLTQSDWDIIKLEDLRETVRKLDYNHPVRQRVEKTLSPFEERLKGLEKRVLRDSYNPFPKIERNEEQFPSEFIYVGGTENSFGETEVTSELQYLLFTCPGSLYDAGAKGLKFTPMLSTRGPVDENSKGTGATSLDNFWTGGVFGSPRRFNPARTLYMGNGTSQVIGAFISGQVRDGNSTNEVNLSLVADADVLADPFYNIRSRGPESDFPLDVDNVTFALNIVDKLAGETKFLDIRNRRRLHRTLEEFEKSIEEAREEESNATEEANESMKILMAEENKKLNQALAEVQTRQGAMTQGQFMQVLQTEAAKLQKNLGRKERELKKETDKKIKSAQRKRDRKIKNKQDTIKSLSVFLPPIPLLLIAIYVFVRKRRAEIQGAHSNRIRN
ncbi:MAG: hypothetical protein CMI26_14130 [Opitutae bacterium]|nr:hypothetical protein [Opitutae bacterium]